MTKLKTRGEKRETRLNKQHPILPTTKIPLSKDFLSEISFIFFNQRWQMNNFIIHRSLIPMLLTACSALK